LSDPVSLLTLQFLEWVARRQRTYDEAMEAWRSTCPRHTVWEEALMAGLIQIEATETPRQSVVTLTPGGRAVLDANGMHPKSPGLEQS
jgi:hypothetical protein